MFPRRIVVAAARSSTSVASGVSCCCTASRFFSSVGGYQPPGHGDVRLPWRAPRAATNQLASSNNNNNINASDVAGSGAGVAHASNAALMDELFSPETLHTTTTTPTPTPTSTAAVAVAALAAALPPRGTPGALRATPARRMPAPGGPSLDSRIEDIVGGVSSAPAVEMLADVLRRLVDPNIGDDVEHVSMPDFCAMQPKRQLMAVGNKKHWLEWLVESSAYKQAARRAATESPAADIAALREAGIHSLHQWAERPFVVKVGAATRSALDAALEESVRAYVKEVSQLVNESTALEHLLIRWIGDVVGKFILDSLKISPESAASALEKRKLAAGVRRGGSSSSPTSGEASNTNTNNNTSESKRKATTEPAIALELLLEEDEDEMISSSSSPGEVCTLEHYLHFVRKVRASIRQDLRARGATTTTAASSAAAAEDVQSAMEVEERTNAVIHKALMQLLQQAMPAHLPQPLRPLYESGHLALDRVPALLQRAVSLLQLRNLPVRSFVFHSTADASVGAAPTSSNSTGSSSSSSSSGATAMMATPLAPYHADGALTLDVAPLCNPPGTFLCGSSALGVSLQEWSGHPIPPPATSTHNPAEGEYLSILHRLRARLERLSMTSIAHIFRHAEIFGGNGFNAADGLGLRQLFGPAKLVEDRLVSALSYPLASAEKPIHFIESGYVSGKSAILDRLATRMRPGERAVVVRYVSSSTPFLPDLDDHPVAFAARFWLRVALACCPWMIRTEELFSRAPKSVMWWGHASNWSWEQIQANINIAKRGGMKTAAPTSNNNNHNHLHGGRRATQQLAAILVDDFDRVLNAMEVKWGRRSVSTSAALSSAPLTHGGGAEADALLLASPDGMMSSNSNQQQQQHGVVGGGSIADISPTLSSATTPAHAAELLRQQSLAYWSSITGVSVEAMLTNAFSKLSAALGQVGLVCTGQRLSPLITAHCEVPCRRYFIPISSGVGLAPRLRVLPLLATLHALHVHAGVELPGLLYETIKNSPALLGKSLESFWPGNAQHNTAVHGQSGPVSGGGGDDGATPLALQRWRSMEESLTINPLHLSLATSSPLRLQSYPPGDIFAELPWWSHLLQHPRRNRLRLVELLQRQLGSPTGFLTTGIDTRVSDLYDGLVVATNHTSSQVHPFSLFAIFSHQDALDRSRRIFINTNGTSGTTTNTTNNKNSGEEEDEMGGGDASSERRVVRAWGEVWAEYRGVVEHMATTPERKREAMRVLLHGALLLRSAAISGANINVHLKVPPYGFPLVASPMRVKKPKSATAAVNAVNASTNVHHHGADSGVEVHAATPDTVRKAIAAYRNFFSTEATQSHFPFRPVMGLNMGCDVVCFTGTTLALYDIATSATHVRRASCRMAEALLGVLHLLTKQVLPADRIRHVRFITVASVEGSTGAASSSTSSSGSTSGGGGGIAAVGANMMMLRGSGDGLAASAAASPYLFDLGAVFADADMDALRELQHTLGLPMTFRTLGDLVEELEDHHGVLVQQEMAATHDELEALFSPTLLQLLPDATVLPPYTSSVVSAEDLMMEALMEAEEVDLEQASLQAAEEDGRDGIDGDDGGAMMLRHMMEAGAPVAETEELLNDARLAHDAGLAPHVKQDLLLADNEHVHESAELLEAMMNEGLDALTGNQQLHATRAMTAQELRNDLAAEDRINYDASVATAALTPPTTTTTTSPSSTMKDDVHDSLAWLHDIITPEVLAADPLADRFAPAHSVGLMPTHASSSATTTTTSLAAAGAAPLPQAAVAGPDEDGAATPPSRRSSSSSSSSSSRKHRTKSSRRAKSVDAELKELLRAIETPTRRGKRPNNKNNNKSSKSSTAARQRAAAKVATAKRGRPQANSSASRNRHATNSNTSSSSSRNKKSAASAKKPATRGASSRRR